MRFDPFTPEALEDPYPQYARFRAEDPIPWSEKLRSWLVFRHEDVGVFFRDEERLSADRVKAKKYADKKPRHVELGIRTVATDPPEHTPVRTMLTTSLNPRVRTVGPRIDELVRILLDALGPAVERVVERMPAVAEVDLISGFAYPLPIDVIAELFDVPEADRAPFRGWSHEVARGMDHFYKSEGVRHGLGEFYGYFHRLVLERKGSRGDDLIHRLLAARVDGDRFSELEVVAMCGTLVFAGHETTVNLIGNGLLALLRHPAERERFASGAVTGELAIEELLRFDSPAQMISRTATRDFEWRGRTIREGDAVLAVIGSANRDPEVFSEPDRLELDRDPNPHVAFGLGTHFCPGALLSRMEGRAAIPALLRRFPRLRLAEAPPVRRPTAVLRGLERLPARLD